MILIKLFLSLSLPPVFEFTPLPPPSLAYVCATNYNKLILMQATAEMAMGSGFRRNSVSELKLKNRCTGSTEFPYVGSGPLRWRTAS